MLAHLGKPLIDKDLLDDMTDSNIAQGTYPIDKDLYAIGLANGGGHAIQRLADQYARVRSDRRRQLRGDALRDDWTTWVKGCAEKWAKP